MNDSSPWRRRLWVWLPAVLFLLVNGALFSAYRLVYAGQAEALKSRLAQRETLLSEREGQVAELSARAVDARANRELLAALYTDRLSTERRRFTQLVAEIKELATRAGLEPTKISYPGEEIAEFGLVKRYFSFTVEGSYSNLREFVRELETTSSFVTLEQVGLSEGNDSGLLQINLKLSTLFGRDNHAPGRAVAASGEAAP